MLLFDSIKRFSKSNCFKLLTDPIYNDFWNFKLEFISMDIEITTLVDELLNLSLKASTDTSSVGMFGN